MNAEFAFRPECLIYPPAFRDAKFALLESAVSARPVSAKFARDSINYFKRLLNTTGWGTRIESRE
jgi:hypothetical protein